MKQNRKNKRILLFLGIPILSIFLLIGGLLLFITVFEYRPPLQEELVIGEGTKELTALNEEISLLSWNIGYLALGEKADFFMDGGKMIRGFSLEDVMANFNAVIRDIDSKKPDIILLQEVDEEAYRSFGFNQVEALNSHFSGYDNSFAYNFKVKFIPYPIPPIRNVKAGLLSLSDKKMEKAERISLHSPFKWPVKTINLKRCILVNRFKIKESDKELVVINLHLEAYDNSGGAQIQLEEMLKLMEEEYRKGNYVIAGGDFNQTFSNVDTDGYKTYGEGVWKPGVIDVDETSFRYLMDDRIPSCRSLDRPYDRSKDFHYYYIDGFVVSKNVEVVDFETLNLDFKNSDHNPVYLKVKLS